MKVSGAKAVHYESGPNMTPLVDVVMVILIFLMLAGSFGTSEHYMVSKTPIHKSGGGQPEPPKPGEIPTTTIEVRIRDNGDFTTPRLAGASGQSAWQSDPEQLRAQLVSMAKDYGSLESVEVVLRPASGTKWTALAPLYDAALRADYPKVAFAMTGS